MDKRTLHIILLSLIMIFIGIPCFAQGRIDKVIEDLEKKGDVETTYAERRNRTKHKLTRITRVLEFSNPKYYQQLVKAFEMERQKALRASKTRKLYVYTFEDNRGISTYSLSSADGNAPYTLVMKWNAPGQNDDESSFHYDGDRNREMELLRREFASCRRQMAQTKRELVMCKKSMAVNF